MYNVSIKSTFLCLLLVNVSASTLAENYQPIEKNRLEPQILVGVSELDRKTLSTEQREIIRGETYNIYSYKTVRKYRRVCVRTSFGRCDFVTRPYYTRIKDKVIGTRTVTDRDLNGKVIRTRSY